MKHVDDNTVPMQTVAALRHLFHPCCIAFFAMPLKTEGDFFGA